MRRLHWLAVLLWPMAAAQVPAAAGSAPPRPDTGVAVAEAPSNDDAFEGRVAAYLLSPDAGVAGLIFEDGRQVAVPPGLGARLAAIVQPGQQARVGARRDEAPGPGSPRTITSIASGLTLAEAATDAAAAPRTAGEQNGGLQPAQAAGVIRLRLRGPRGETNGLLLDSGAQIFFAPHVAKEAGDWLQPGDAIRVDGFGRTSRYGTALQATRITGSGGRATTIFKPPARKAPQ